MRAEVEAEESAGPIPHTPSMVSLCSGSSAFRRLTASGPDLHDEVVSFEPSPGSLQAITIEGVTGVNAPTYNFQINAFWDTACGQAGSGRGATVSNVKAMSWYYTTDGIMAGRDALIEDSFFKVNDDALKIFQSNTLVQRCTIWQLDNGMPFMISWI